MCFCKLFFAIKSALVTVKQQEFKAQQLAQKQSQFQWFLGIAFLFLLLEFFMPNTKFIIKNWFQNRQINLVFILFFVSTTAFSQEKKTANFQQKEKQLRTIKAKEKTQEQQAEYNLGNTIYKNKKYGEVITNYKNAALIAKNNLQKHKAFHNLGNAYMQDKNYKLAVSSYKNALKANSKDEKTRYNLALAKKLLKKYPPKPNPKKNKKDKENKQQKDKKNSNKKDKKSPKKPTANNQRMDNVLKAISNAEKKVQEKVNANKTKTNTISTEKDW